MAKPSKQPPLDFRRIAAEALNGVESVLGRWLPDGKREGAEWVALNPTRSDQRTGSFSVNMSTGVWSDFATGDKGGDLVSLVAYVESVEQSNACRALAQFLGVNPHRAQGQRPEAKASSRAVAGSYRAIQPVPAGALAQRPKAHPKHGEPSQTWEYRGADGQPLYYVSRFDDQAGARGKTYAPLSYGEQDGRQRWYWKAVPPPRPLYGLERLAAQPAVPVVLVEGEKAADAAETLFPGSVVMSWPGGAKAIKEADFSPLRARDVWYWPDNDGPGRSSVEVLRAALSAAGAASLAIVAMEPFQRYQPTWKGFDEGGSWPEKADAADAVAIGWTAAHLSQLQQRNELLVVAAAPPEVAPVAPRRFVVNSSGVHLCDAETGSQRRICARLDIVALSRAHDGRGWGLLVRFQDRDGVEKEWNIPMALFAGETCSEVIAGLLDRGLAIEGSGDAKRRLREYLQSAATEARVLLVNRGGWHGDAFVLGGRIFGKPAEPIHYYSEGPLLCRTDQAGTLNEWRETIGEACIGNWLVCFAVSISFAAPLLDLIGAESSGFHFVGDSSLGKSTLLKLAASVCGSPVNYPRTWRATDNALEAIAAAHCDLILILDEIGQCDPRIIGEVTYMLGNGEGKSRANDRGGARSGHHQWRVIPCSSGERTLEQHMGEAGRKPQAGMEQRLMSVPACLHSSEENRRALGIYQHTAGHPNGAAFSDYLLRKANRHYGTALPVFLDQLANRDMRPEVASWLLRYREEFAERVLTPGASGQARRAADKFALVAAAGELASRWGITGWPAGEADKAAMHCFRAWLGARGGEGNVEERRIIEQLRHHFEVYGESRYTRWEADEPRVDEHAPRTMERYGFRRTEETRDPLKGDSTETVFYVFTEAFRKDVCKGIDYSRAARLLAVRGALKHEKDRFTGKARLPGQGGKPVSCYIVRQSCLVAEAD